MPSYITNPQAQQVGAVYPGSRLNLYSSGDTNVTKTLQFAIGPVPGGNPRLTLINTSNVDCPMELAATDSDANYASASGIVVSSGTSFIVNVQGGWMRGHFASAPSSGNLIVVA
jgi:hypothetical protein